MLVKNNLLFDARIKRLAIYSFFNMVGFTILNGGLRLGVFPYLSRILGAENLAIF
jgi:hypothetical protein